MPAEPLISIITSTYNALEALPVTRDSIFRQSFRDFEWIVVDGGSSDGTAEWLADNQNLFSSWVSEPDQGIYDAWNKGVALARGRWVLFLGAGDTLGPHWLEALSAVSEQHDFVYGDLVISTSEGRRQRISKSRKWADAWLRMPYEMSVPHVGSAHHRRLFERSTFDCSYRIIGDWEFLIRSCKRPGLYLEGHVQAVMAWGGTSNQAVGVRKQFAEISRMMVNNRRQMPVRLKAKWLAKSLLSRLPSTFSRLQSVYWWFRTGSAR